MSRIRRYFATGLLVTLPIFFTFYFLFIILRFIDGVWGKLINLYLKKHLGFAVPGVGIILGLMTVFLVGFCATNFFGKRVLLGIEHWFLKLPFIKQVYPALRQIVDSLISKEKTAFKKVVLVEYPSKGIWSVGFVTSEASFKEANAKTGRELIHVLIPTTPSPLTGFLLLYPLEEVKFLDISIEEGIKLVVSGGIVKPQP